MTDIPGATALKKEILLARQRVYQLIPATPLEKLILPGDVTVYLKREDLSPIHAYKWRGAYNRMIQLSPEELARGVVTASAGNHAQGVALAARVCGTHARIFMPETTPMTKQLAVRHHGRDAVEIILVGTTFGDATQEAVAEQARTGRIYVDAFDNLQVMAGQGTIADEIALSGEGPFDAAFLQIGGGGMAASVGLWLKENFPNIRLIGVEGEEQASFRLARQHGAPTTMEDIDIFCDGTAVSRVGDLTFPILDQILDDYMTVSNDAVCAAIQTLWTHSRCLPEPSGAMGFAGLRERIHEFHGKKVLVIICGSNIDFATLALISQRAPFGNPERHFWRFEIGEEQGELQRLLSEFFTRINLVDFQYGKTDREQAVHTIGFEASEAETYILKRQLSAAGVRFSEVSGRTDVRFRVIRYRPELFHYPLFARIDFNERPGALLEIIKQISPHAKLCYLNYQYTGERVGRALVGFDFTDPAARTNFRTRIPDWKESVRHIEALSPETEARLLL